MATQTATTKLEPIGTALLEQLAGLDARNLSPDTARTFLQLQFDEDHQRRVAELSRRAQEGSILPAEEKTLDEYIRAADLLAILHSRARQALKRAGLS